MGTERERDVTDRDRKSVYSQRSGVFDVDRVVPTCPAPLCQEITTPSPRSPTDCWERRSAFDVLKKDLQCNLAFHLFPLFFCLWFIWTLANLLTFSQVGCNIMLLCKGNAWWDNGGMATINRTWSVYNLCLCHHLQSSAINEGHLWNWKTRIWSFSHFFNSPASPESHCWPLLITPRHKTASSVQQLLEILLWFCGHAQAAGQRGSYARARESE